MHDKKKIIIIISVIVLCVLGICYYAKDFIKNKNITNDIQKNTVTNKINIKEDKKLFDVAKTDGQIGKDKVQTVKQCTNMLGENDKKQPIVVRNDEIFIADNTGEGKVIRKLPSGTVIDSTCGGKNIVAWIERGSKPINGSEVSSRSIYCYDMKDKAITKIAEDKNEHTHDAFYIKSFEIDECLSMHDDRVYYEAIETKGNKCLRRIFMYNPAEKKSIEVYTDDNTDTNSSNAVCMFDIDFDKGYLFYSKGAGKSADGTEKKCLVMVNMNQKPYKKKVLAVSDDDIDVAVKYPYTAFFLNKKIHLYNIAKGYDEACIKYDYPLIYGIDIADDKLIFANTKVYCYSIKDKKLYNLEESEKGSGSGYFSGVRGDNVCWCSEGTIYYMKLSDIKG